MNVLIINDNDGHCHAYDISDDEKRLKVYTSLVEGFVTRGTGNWSGDQVKKQFEEPMRAALVQKDIDGLTDIFEQFEVGFGRSYGCRLYEVEVESVVDARVCSNIG